MQILNISAFIQPSGSFTSMPYPHEMVESAQCAVTYFNGYQSNLNTDVEAIAPTATLVGVSYRELYNKITQPEANISASLTEMGVYVSAGVSYRTHTQNLDYVSASVSSMVVAISKSVKYISHIQYMDSVTATLNAINVAISN